MPHLAQKPHRRRRQRIIFRKAQLGGEKAAFKGRVFGALDQRFPDEDVVFRDRARGYAVRGRGGEEAVFVEEAPGGDGGWGCHFFFFFLGGGSLVCLACAVRGGGVVFGGVLWGVGEGWRL